MKRIYWIGFHELNEDYLSKYDRDFRFYEYSKECKIDQRIFADISGENSNTNFMSSVQSNSSIDIKFNWN